MKIKFNKRILIIILMALLFILLFNVKVYAVDEPFALEAESIDVCLNGTGFISYTGGTMGESITWSSSDPTIATIENGNVNGLKIGTTTITATKGSETASCKVNVVYSAIEILGKQNNTITSVNLILEEHESETLSSKVKDNDFVEVTGAQVEWESSDSSIVTVEKNTGVIKAQKKGTATITAKAAGVSDTVQVNVYNAPEFTDFSKAKYKSEIDNDIVETLKISEIELNEDDSFYYIITPTATKPDLILSSYGSIDYEKNGDTVEALILNIEDNYMYTRKLAKYTELNQDLYLWIIQEVRLEGSYVDEENNNVSYSTKFVVEGEKIERAELPALNLILQRFHIGHWSDTTTNENENYTNIKFNFPTVQKNRKFALKIGKVTDINILSKIQNNDYSGITELLSYAKNHDAIYSQTLTTTDVAYFSTEETLFDGSSLLDHKAYYYIYVEFDDENGKYYPIEGVTLGQAWKLSTDNEDWDLYAYTADNFEWDNLKPSYSETTKEDTTVADTVFPNAGKKTIITILLVIAVLGTIIYKKYNKLNDIK